MATHWTYSNFKADDDLSQGDILEPTASLQALLAQVHPHFLDPKYLAFLITTQSCDLTIRKDKCATKYICISVVRPLSMVLHDFLPEVCKCVRDRVYLQESKGEAKKLLERLFSQNEQALGLFYLHPDLDSGIAESSVALLRVCVTLRAEHYPILKLARRGALTPEFQAKLGWLVGNMYSRIGTTDWTSPKERQKALERLISDALSIGDLGGGPMWVPGKWVDAAKQKGCDIDALPKEALLKTLESYKPAEAIIVALEQVLNTVQEVLPDTPIDQLKRIKQRLNNNPLFANALSRQQ